jgi:hypothetical protein
MLVSVLPVLSLERGAAREQDMHVAVSDLKK